MISGQGDDGDDGDGVDYIEDENSRIRVLVVCSQTDHLQQCAAAGAGTAVQSHLPEDKRWNEDIAKRKKTLPATTTKKLHHCLQKVSEI